MRNRIVPQALAPALLAAALAAAPAVAADPDPHERADQTTISLTGEVASVERNLFVLDHGDGTVTVEFDDGDRDADAYRLVEGDRVTVYGVVDDDLLERTTIEADRVYVEKLGTAFHASAIDEEDVYRHVVDVPAAVSTTVLQGAITAVGEESFELYTGTRGITVRVGQMPHDPLDREGRPRLAVGDVVTVRGDIDHDLFDRRVFIATSVIALSD